MAVQSVRGARRSPDPGRPTGHPAVRRALACFVAAYLAVTILAAGTTLIYAAVNNTFAADAAATSPVKAPSFAATVPYHVLIMLVIWPLFAWLYFRGSNQPGVGSQVRGTWLLAISWILGAMLVDFVGFVAIKNPWSLSPRQFYIDYQPWITLIYVAIFLSPWVRLLITKLAAMRASRRSVVA
jgi:hypothetical protein